ncbi:hypothetical protein CsatB_025740 [Cannabis sativa]
MSVATVARSDRSEIIWVATEKLCFSDPLAGEAAACELACAVEKGKEFLF